MAPRSEILDAFWLPRDLRHLAEEARWEVHHVLRGQEVAEGEGVAVRWPNLSREQWRALLAGLDRARAPAGDGLLERWHKAFEGVTETLAEQSEVLQSISLHTGYPVEMFLLAFGRSSLVHIEAIARTREGPPTWACARQWQPMPGRLGGLVRFYPERPVDRIAARFRKGTGIFAPAAQVDLGLGFAAGNIPGNGLILALLLHLAGSLSVEAADRQARAPAVVVRNSRQAPLMSPWVLSAIEQEDPELVAGIAMLIWDYQDHPLEAELLGRSGLVVAAASDETIAAIAEGLRTCGSSARFHAHGHKISFDAIAREALARGGSGPARPAALDSALWDQYGCLSARVHFVERGGGGEPEDYAEALSLEMRTLAEVMPRGASPIRLIRRAYENYKLLEPAGAIRVFSQADDPFLVVRDSRPWNDYLLRETVNACVGRVVVVREVDDLAEIPGRYLSRIPARNLQTLGVAAGAERIPALAEAAGACGVTALRPLGRASFPHLAYSWDGLLPLDLGSLRPPGYFTTVESLDTLSEL